MPLAPTTNALRAKATNTKIFFNWFLGQCSADPACSEPKIWELLFVSLMRTPGKPFRTVTASPLTSFGCVCNQADFPLQLVTNQPSLLPRQVPCNMIVSGGVYVVAIGRRCGFDLSQLWWCQRFVPVSWSATKRILGGAKRTSCRGGGLGRRQFERDSNLQR